VIKSISCIGDPSYQRLKTVLSLENTDRIIESLRRLLNKYIYIYIEANFFLFKFHGFFSNKSLLKLYK